MQLADFFVDGGADLPNEDGGWRFINFRQGR
jgi:hypothetical protein